MNPQTGIYGWSPGSGGVHHYRVAEPLRVAGDCGVHVGSGNRLDDEICATHDTIIGHMIWDERPSQAWEILAAKGSHRLVFDIDDVMWSPDWDPFVKHYTTEVLYRVWRNIRLAHVVTTPSPVIAEYVSTFNPNVWVVPNTVPLYLTELSMPPRPPSVTRSLMRAEQPRFVVGYQGSPSHEHDWPAWLERDLLRFLTARPRWDLHFWGPDEIPGWPPQRVGHTPWKSSVRDYYMSLSMDIGIGHLKPSVFNAGKSSLRAVEFAALGIPAVLSAGPAYDGWVDHGSTGLLIDPGDSWYDALHALAGDDIMRARMAQNAREKALDWTTEACIGRWVEAWNSV